MKWGILGLDLIAYEFIEKLEKLNIPYAIYCEDQRSAVMQKNVRIYHDIEDLLTSEDIDIVYILSLIHI